jgi:SAM-dependent methyltransferase
MIYPPEIRDLSLRHWTPVAVARRAADFLVGEPETRVLDLGCGTGKILYRRCTHDRRAFYGCGTA